MRRVLLVPALALSFAVAAPAQEAPPPAFDWISILNMRFYPAMGGFMVSDVQALLLPAGTTEGLLLVQRGGATIARDQLSVRPAADVPAVSIAERTSPGGFAIAQAGDLTLAFQVGGRTLTEVPVTLSQVAGGDAYNPTRTWVREGPWRLAGVHRGPRRRRRRAAALLLVAEHPRDAEPGPRPAHGPPAARRDRGRQGARPGDRLVG